MHKITLSTGFFSVFYPYTNDKKVKSTASNRCTSYIKMDFNSCTCSKAILQTINDYHKRNINDVNNNYFLKIKLRV